MINCLYFCPIWSNWNYTLCPHLDLGVLTICERKSWQILLIPAVSQGIISTYWQMSYILTVSLLCQFLKNPHSSCWAVVSSTITLLFFSPFVLIANSYAVCCFVLLNFFSFLFFPSGPWALWEAWTQLGSKKRGGEPETQLERGWK